LALVSLSVAGCATAYGGGRDSPFESRLELRLSPILHTVSSETMEIRPTVAYERAFGGGGANAIHAGGQIRFPSGLIDGRPWFVGGEGQYVARFPGPFHSSRFGGLFGVRLLERQGDTNWSLHLTAAGGLSQSGGTGLYFRVGLEWNPLAK
jgi:hypothetical protein